MTEARRNNRLQAGDTFRFAEGTLIEIHDQARGMQRRYTRQREQFIVLRAEPSTGGDRMGSFGDNGGWRVWAAPKGTPLEQLQDCTIHFYQDGPYAARALVRIVLIEAAKQRTQFATALRAA